MVLMSEENNLSSWNVHKQTGCRKYKLIIGRSSLTYAVKVFDLYTLYRSLDDQVHPDQIGRYLNRYVRDDKTKEIIRTTTDVHGIETLKVNLDIFWKIIFYRYIR